MVGGILEPSSYFRQYANAGDWLRHEFSQRRTRNPSYSLRAFAKLLKVSPGALSELLNNKRNITPKYGAQLAIRLGFSPSEKSRFLDLIKQSRSRNKVNCALQQNESDRSYQQLPSDLFALICDWYHYALLSLMETRDFRSDPKWIARRLSISVTETKIALERLRRLRFIKKEGGTWIPSPNWATTDDVPSEALRHYHRQGLEQALHAIDTVPLPERDITSIVMAVDPQRLKLAKLAIKKMRRTIAEMLECGEKKEVYRLNIQLIPITHKEKTE